MKKRVTIMLLLLAMLLVIAPVTVHAAKTVSSVNIIYDVADFQLYEGSIEEDVGNNIQNKTIIDTEGVIIRKGYSFTGLEYKENKYSYTWASNSSKPVEKTKNYYMCIRIRLEDGYEWAEEIKQLVTRTCIPLTELHTFKVFLNKKLNTGDGYVKRYEDLNDGIDIAVPIANDITTISLSPNSFTYDGKAKKPSVTSARLKNGDLVNSRMYEVFYVDKNDREITPIAPGTYYVLLKGTGIYGTGRKEFTIKVNNHVHTWDSGKITTPPTEKSSGIKTYTCTSCGETKIEVIPKLAITVPKKPTIEKPIADKTKIIVRWTHFKHTSKNKKNIWKKIKRVQIQCSTDKNFTNIVKEKSVGKGRSRVTLKGLKRKTIYYVRVRYFDGKGYSKWSKAKKAKTKK